MLTLRRCGDNTPLFEYPGDSWPECIAAARKAKIVLRAVDFSSAQLQYVDFSDMALTSTSFVGADLSHAQFVNADLRHSLLSRAGLCSAVLEKANLYMATCHGTILDRATLRGADFGAADLTDASLVGANCFETVFAGAELQGARFALARNWELSQITYGQMLHYRDDLWLLLCELPELAELLLQDVRDICGQHSDDELLTVLRWSNLYEIVDRLRPPERQRNAAYSATSTRRFAREWFMQFSDPRPCGLVRRTGAWVLNWQSCMSGLSAMHFTRAADIQTTPVTTRPHPRNIRTD